MVIQQQNEFTNTNVWISDDTNNFSHYSDELQAFKFFSEMYTKKKNLGY